MRSGDTIATYDVGLALRGKSGKFEVTSPTGEIYDVTCKSSHSISNLEWSSNGTDNPPFLIRKVAEAVPQAGMKAATTAMLEQDSQIVSSPLPFVLGHAEDGEHSPSGGNIELLYLDKDPGSGHPSACVYLKSERRDQVFEAEELMTSRCGTFNDLDSEIRKLEAQLDEIRSRAKKMFYKAHVVALSA